MNLVETVQVPPGYTPRKGESLTISMGAPGGPNLWTITRMNLSGAQAANHALVVKQARERWAEAERKAQLRDRRTR